MAMAHQVHAHSKHGEECVELNSYSTFNHPKRCEKTKGYVCDAHTRRCACAKGAYNKDMDRCTAKMGADCALQHADTPYIQCEHDNAYCDTTRGSPTYEKCACRPGENCGEDDSLTPAPLIVTVTQPSHPSTPTVSSSPEGEDFRNSSAAASPVSPTAVVTVTIKVTMFAGLFAAFMAVP